LKQLDIVQVMTVKTGYQNQEFQASALETVKRLVSRLQKLNPTCEIFVDGGINAENWKQCKAAGATCAAVGHDLWSAKNIAEELQTLQSIQ
jgi:ribulose-phosphate 3-epimerase